MDVQKFRRKKKSYCFLYTTRRDPVGRLSPHLSRDDRPTRHFFFLLTVLVSPASAPTAFLLLLSVFCGCTTRGICVLLGWFCCWLCCCVEFALMTILGSTGFLTGGAVAAAAGHTLFGTHGTTGDLCSSGIVSGWSCLPNGTAFVPWPIVSALSGLFRPNVDDIRGGGGGGIFVAPPPSAVPAISGGGGGSDSLRSAPPHCAPGKSGNTFGYLILRTASGQQPAPVVAYSLEVTFMSS